MPCIPNEKKEREKFNIDKMMQSRMIVSEWLIKGSWSEIVHHFSFEGKYFSIRER